MLFDFKKKIVFTFVIRVAVGATGLEIGFVIIQDQVLEFLVDI